MGFSAVSHNIFHGALAEDNFFLHHLPLCVDFFACFVNYRVVSVSLQRHRRRLPEEDSDARLLAHRFRRFE